MKKSRDYRHWTDEEPGISLKLLAILVLMFAGLVACAVYFWDGLISILTGAMP